MSTQCSTDSVLIFATHRTMDGEEYVPLVRPVDHFSPLWRIPGGLVHEREYLKVAAVREYKEETGLALHDLSQEILVKEVHLRYNHLLKHRQYFFIGKVRSLTGMFCEPVADGKELLTVKLFSLNAIRNYLFEAILFDEYEILLSHLRILKRQLRLEAV